MNFTEKYLNEEKLNKFSTLVKEIQHDSLIERINIINIEIIKTKLTGIDNLKIIQELTSFGSKIDDNYVSDQHHTYYEDTKYPSEQPECKKLITALTEAVCSILKREMVMAEIWSIFLKEGESVAAHSHKSNMHYYPHEYYSIAYYPSAPEDSADLIFMADACNTIDTMKTITPKTGDLIIFNSFLMHMTNRHRNPNERRVVVSANFMPKNPNRTANQDWSGYLSNN